MCQHRRVQPTPSPDAVPLGCPRRGYGGRRCLPRLGGRLRGARLPAAPGRGAGAPARPAPAARAAPLRPAPDAGPAAQAGLGPRAGRPRAGPRRQHRRQPGPPRRGARGAGRARPAARAAGCLRDGLQRLLRADAQEPGALPAARAGRSAWASAGCRPRTCATGCSPPAGSTWTTPGPGSRSTTARSSWSAPTTRTSAPTATPRSPAPADPSADLSLGVTHAPYRRVLDPMVADGFGTGARRPHPRRPALRPRRRRPGHQLRPAPAAGQGPLDLAVGRPDARGCTSPPGSGTSPYAPVRFACPPEATLLTLVARPS